MQWIQIFRSRCFIWHENGQFDWWHLGQSLDTTPKTGGLSGNAIFGRWQWFFTSITMRITMDLCWLSLFCHCIAKLLTSWGWLWQCKPHSVGYDFSSCGSQQCKDGCVAPPCQSLGPMGISNESTLCSTKLIYFENLCAHNFVHSSDFDWPNNNEINACLTLESGSNQQPPCWICLLTFDKELRVSTGGTGGLHSIEIYLDFSWLGSA